MSCSSIATPPGRPCPRSAPSSSSGRALCCTTSRTCCCAPARRSSPLRFGASALGVLAGELIDALDGLVGAPVSAFTHYSLGAPAHATRRGRARPRAGRRVRRNPSGVPGPGPARRPGGVASPRSWPWPTATRSRRRSRCIWRTSPNEWWVRAGTLGGRRAGGLHRRLPRGRFHAAGAARHGRRQLGPAGRHLGPGRPDGAAAIRRAGGLRAAGAGGRSAAPAPAPGLAAATACRSRPRSCWPPSAPATPRTCRRERGLRPVVGRARLGGRPLTSHRSDGVGDGSPARRATERAFPVGLSTRTRRSPRRGRDARLA